MSSILQSLAIALSLASLSPLRGQEASVEQGLIQKLAESGELQKAFEQAKSQSAQFKDETIERLISGESSSAFQKAIEKELFQMVESGEIQIQDIGLKREKRAKTPKQVDLTPELVGGMSEKEQKHLDILGDYLKNKLEEAIYGPNKRAYNLEGQSVFFRLMETQLGKTILSSVSEYCLHAIPRQGGKDLKLKENLPPFAKVTETEDQKKVRSYHLNSLEGIEVSSSQQVSGPALSHFNLCLLSIKHIAQSTKSCQKGGKNPGEISVAGDKDCPEDSLPFFDGSAREYDSGTIRNEAKMAHHQIEKLRNDLQRTTQIKDDFEKVRSPSAYSARERKFFKETHSIESTDEALHLSSGEYLEASSGKGGESVAEALASEAKNFEKDCIQDQSRSNCSTLYSEEEAKKRVEESQEIYVRSVATAKKISAMSEDEFREELKKEGRSDTEIDVLFSRHQGEKFQELKDDYAMKFLDAKKAVIEKYANELDLLEAKTQDPEQKARLQKRIQADLDIKAQKNAEFIHYTNVVSGYLGIQSDDSDEKRYNKLSVVKELENSYLTNHELYGTNQTANRQRSERLIENASQLPGYDDVSTNLSVENVNKSFVSSPGTPTGQKVKRPPASQP